MVKKYFHGYQVLSSTMNLRYTFEKHFELAEYAYMNMQIMETCNTISRTVLMEDESLQ